MCDLYKSAQLAKMAPVSTSFEVSKDTPDIENLLALNPKTKVIEVRLVILIKSTPTL